MDIIQNDYITHDSIIGSVDISEADFEKNIVEYGDILFQRSSETREEVGQANVYLDKYQNATFGGFVIRGKKKEEYDPSFMNALLKTASARKEITSKSGGSTRYNVGQDTLSKVIVQTTTLPEQQKIASFLTSVDKQIELLKEKKNQLEAYKKGVMQRLFLSASGFTGLKDEQDLDIQPLRFKDEHRQDFPDWEEKRLGEIGIFFSGGTPSSTNKSFYSGNIPFIKSGEINSTSTTQFLSQEGIDNSSAKLVERGDLLIAIYGATSGEVAIAKLNGAINQAIICIRGEFNNSYLLNWLKLSKDRIVNKYLQGGQGNLSAEIIKNITINLPSLPEQQKIASFLSGIDKQIEKVGEQIVGATQFKKGLLQKMFV